MRNRLIYLRIGIALVTLGMLFTGCSTSAQAKAKNVTSGTGFTTVAPEEITVETTLPEPDRFFSVELTSINISQNNLLGDPGVETIYIYLPPDYFETALDYPVVYYLHGYGDAPGSFLRSAQFQLDKYFASNDVPSFIMVEIDGTGYSSGTFYANSPVTGSWETYVTDDVILYIDTNYRTLDDASSRGICGFSMGGYGALHLAFLHPDLFSCVYAMSPGVLADGDLPEAMDTWAYESTFKTAYSRVFAPVTDGSSTTLGQIPSFDGSEEDNAVIAKWYAGFGDWSQKIANYTALDQTLSHVGIYYGTADGYTWIPKGCESLLALLRENGIESEVSVSDDGHTLPERPITDHLGPFFSAGLISSQS